MAEKITTSKTNLIKIFGMLNTIEFGKIDSNFKFNWWVSRNKKLLESISKSIIEVDEGFRNAPRLVEFREKHKNIMEAFSDGNKQENPNVPGQFRYEIPKDKQQDARNAVLELEKEYKDDLESFDKNYKEFTDDCDKNNTEIEVVKISIKDIPTKANLDLGDLEGFILETPEQIDKILSE